LAESCSFDLSFVRSMRSRHIVQTGLSCVFFLSVFLGNMPLGYADSEDDGSKPESTASPIVARILIDLRDCANHETKWIEMARNVIFLREGDQFSATRLQESIEALKLSKKFREINVESKEENKRITLLFHLAPFRLIKDIEIDGKFPLFEREILNAMTIHTGDVFVQETLRKQEELIGTVFRREGFVAPKVRVTARQDPADGHFAICVKIDKGPYWTLNPIQLRGNRVFSDAKLKLKMKTWRVSLLPGSAGRFIEKNLKEDIRRLTAHYRKKHYPDVAIDFKIEKDAGTHCVCIFVTIDEGARYDVEFVGNERFWDRTLRKDLVLFEEGNRYNLGLRKTTKKMKERYRMAGYLETRVKIEETTKTVEDQKVRLVRFVIEEGPCSIVRSIRIEGNHAFEEEKIRKQMLTRLPGFREPGVFVTETLEEDLYAIKSLYIKQGYMDAKVKEEVKWSEDKRDVTVSLRMEEGVQTLVSSVKITGITVLSEEKAYGAILLKQGEPFRRYLVRSDENALSALISEKGYPYIEVKGDVSFSENRSKARLVFSVNQGPHVEMGQVYYTGNFRTKDKILQNELEIEPGDPFSPAKMLQGQRNIRNLKIFDSVKFKTIGLKEKNEKINLFVEVEEKKPYFVQAGGGYETDRGFFVHTKLGDHNLFGTNKDGWLGGGWSQIGYDGALAITEPRLFGSRISATFGLFGERREEFNQAFGTTILGSSLGFSRKWFRYVSTGLGFRFERRNQFRRDSEDPASRMLEDDSDEFDPRSILVTTPSITYDRRDSFIRPRKGVFSSLSVDISKGLTNALDDFFKYRLDLRYYWSPLHRLTLAWLGRAGYIDPYGSIERVPEDQLFFLGGTSDVRGFDENLLRFDGAGDPVGGRTAVVGSIEARIDLGHNFELATFYDVGRVTDTFQEVGRDEFRSSVGVGLRYVTPVGPIGFLYGMKLDRQEDESPGRLHFSVGYTF
jgi:outer membrane protein insertion porin family